MTTTEASHPADHNAAGNAPLRRVALQDLPKLETLDKEVFGDLAYSMSLLRTFFGLFQTTWHVADHAGDLAGYALVGLSSTNREGWLLGLAVHHRHRGLGLGRKLMSRAMASMMEHKVDDAYLTIRPDNHTAHSIYHSFDFRQLGEEVPDYYGNGEPRAVLHRSLKMNPYVG